MPGLQDLDGGLALAICGLLAPAPAAAGLEFEYLQRCHRGRLRTLPIPVPDSGPGCAAPNTTFGLGESFMNSQALFQAHANAQARSTVCNVSVDENSRGAEATGHLQLPPQRARRSSSAVSRPPSPTRPSARSATMRCRSPSPTIAQWRWPTASLRPVTTFDRFAHGERRRLLGGKCPRGRQHHQPLDVHGRPDDPLHAVRRGAGTR